MEKEEDVSETQNGFHGVLRYRGEHEWKKSDLVPPSPSDRTVWCEFCGGQEKPPLDFSKTRAPEDFCCAQYMEMYKKVEQHWRLLQERSDESSQEYDSNMEKVQEAKDRPKSYTIPKQVVDDGGRKPKRPSSSTQNDMPGCKVTSSGMFTTITFRLSDYLRAKRDERPTARKHDIKEEKVGLSTLCTPKCLDLAGFGVRLHQGLIQKFYSNGNKFFASLPDGTAQVFYPSGNLAIMSFIDGTEGICFVIDDTETSCPIRAFFKSSGLAHCYHSNGSTWLQIDEWGGQSLNEDGSRRMKWKWTDQAPTPTPFKPIHLSLNRNIGVRVLGRESVYVTFLASGQQARFNVGSCAKPSPPGPSSLSTDDVMLRVIQLKARLALERLRWCLNKYMDTKHQSVKLPPALVSQGQRLLKLSSNISMEDKDITYIQHCLQDCQ